MTRTHMNHEEREAMHLLDLLRAGEEVPETTVAWALRVTGDALGLREFTDDGEPVFTLERRNVQ